MLRDARGDAEPANTHVPLLTKPTTNTLMKSSDVTILPITRPSITVNPRIANLLSIIERRPRGLSWAYTWFVELGATVVDDTYDIGLRRSIGFSTCPLIDARWVTAQDISSRSGLIEFLISELNDGRFVIATFDHFWIPASIRYQVRRFLHNSMIVGYYGKSEEFLAADFFGRAYGLKRVPFAAASRSFSGVDQRERRLSHIVHGNDGHAAVALSVSWSQSSYQFRRKTLARSIDDYLKCNRSVFLTPREQEMYREPRGVRVGLCFYDEILRWLVATYNDWPGVHVGRSMYKLAGLLYEHKRFMRKRVEWLSAHGYIGYRHLDGRFEALEREAAILRNLLLKYELQATKNGLKGVIEGIGRIRDLDSDAMHKLLGCLQSQGR